MSDEQTFVNETPSKEKYFDNAKHAAVTFADMGWRVFPCRETPFVCPDNPKKDSPIKAPYIGMGKRFEKASCDYKTVTRWWSKYPNALIGYRLPNDIFVIDADSPSHDPDGNHADGISHFHKIWNEHGGTLPIQTMAAISRSGGRHYYFAIDPAIKVKNDNRGKVGEGIDVKAEGGYVILPPSDLDDQGYYSWVQGRSPWDITPMPAPEWLIEIVRDRDEDNPKPAPAQRKITSVTTEYGQAVLDGEAAKVATAPVGQRNDTLNKAACKVGSKVAAGLIAEADAHATLVAAAEQAHLDPAEIEPTYASGMRKGLSNPIGKPEPAEDPVPPKRGKLSSVLLDDDFYETPTMQLVEGLLPETGYGFMYGDSGASKTRLAGLLAFNLAYGSSDFMGYAIREPRDVVYVALEGEEGIKREFAAFRKQYKTEYPRLVRQLHLVQKQEVRLDRQGATQIIDFVAGQSLRRPVVIIDTLSRAKSGQDENAAGEMEKAVDAMADISRRTDGLVIALHHTAKGSREMRGSCVLKCNADFAILCEKIGSTFRAEVTKQKDGPNGIGFTFRLDLVDLVTRDGEPYSTVLPILQRTFGAEADSEMATKEDRKAELADLVMYIAEKLNEDGVTEFCAGSIISKAAELKIDGLAKRDTVKGLLKTLADSQSLGISKQTLQTTFYSLA